MSINFINNINAQFIKQKREKSFTMVTVSKSSNVSIIKTHKVMTQKYHISISAVHCEIKS